MDSLTQLDSFEQYWSLFQHDSNYLNDDTLLTEKEFNITSLPLSTLLDKLSTGKLTSLETTIAFIKKEIISRTSSSKSKLNNHRQEFMDAIRKARYLDWYLAKYGRPIGVLHGLPISCKQLKSLNINNDGKELGNISIDSKYD
ncbi:Acetamidase [Spathaspora sp. JA1]|nr:Acetamidase [Spathaspora sp. JA1]